MSELLLSFELEGVPVSSNGMYKNIGRGRALTTEAKAWKAGVTADVKNIINHQQLDFRSFAKKPLRAKYYFCVPELYRADWDGYIKALQDSTMDAMGLDDRYIVSAEAHKMLDKERPRFKVEIWSL
ncbi:MAG: RusA family crossover junction endodeoxyribonuclease [Ignavibacteriae bacterium]|nr:RusA family crossover junction endodeoxyribonuclease [Ignavibacteriota bacterium]